MDTKEIIAPKTVAIPSHDVVDKPSVCGASNKKPQKRIYHHHDKWEDFQSGLFRRIKKEEEEVYIRLSCLLLQNPDALYKAMMGVIDTWVYSSEVNLTNPSRNKQAFLGQAACCYEFRVTENLTMIAWNRLTEKQQKEANLIADIVIDEWHERNIK